MQARLLEQHEAHDREQDEGHAGQVREAGRGQVGQDPAEQRAADQAGALDDADPADPVFVEVAAAGLLQHGVVDDAVDGAGGEREVDAEHQGRYHVGGYAVAEPADQ